MPGPPAPSTPTGRASTRWMMFSLMSCSPEVMNRLTPSMCQEPSSCGMALVRPAPTSEPASGSVSTMVAPHWRSIMMLRRSACRGRCRCGRATWRSSGRRRTSRPAGSRRAPARRSPSAAMAGRGWPPSSAGSSRREPLGVHAGVVALLERLRASSTVRGLRVEDRRVAVAVLEGRGELLAGQAVDLAEDRARGVDVDLLERARAEHLVAAEDLEEVELDVAQVGLVVAHCSTFELRRYRRAQARAAAGMSALLVSNFIMLPTSSGHKSHRDVQPGNACWERVGVSWSGGPRAAGRCRGPARRAGRGPALVEVGDDARARSASSWPPGSSTGQSTYLDAGDVGALLAAAEGDGHGRWRRWCRG